MPGQLLFDATVLLVAVSLLAGWVEVFHRTPGITARCRAQMLLGFQAVAVLGSVWLAAEALIVLLPGSANGLVVAASLVQVIVALAIIAIIVACIMSQWGDTKKAVQGIGNEAKKLAKAQELGRQIQGWVEKVVPRLVSDPPPTDDELLAWLRELKAFQDEAKKLGEAPERELVGGGYMPPLGPLFEPVKPHWETLKRRLEEMLERKDVTAEEKEFIRKLMERVGKVLHPPPAPGG